MRIDITAVVEQRGLDMGFVAAQLFPRNKHPRMALTRVVKSEALLNELQVSKLALLAGLTLQELYTGGPWQAKYSANVHVFSTKEFTAELDTETWTTRLFHDGSMFHETIMHKPQIGLREYIASLNTHILNFRKDG